MRSRGGRLYVIIVTRCAIYTFVFGFREDNHNVKQAEGAGNLQISSHKPPIATEISTRFKPENLDYFAIEAEPKQPDPISISERTCKNRDGTDIIVPHQSSLTRTPKIARSVSE